MNTFISSSIDVFILMRYFNCSRILAVLIPPHRTVLLQELLEMDNFVPHIRETYLSTYSAPPSLHGWLMVDALDVWIYMVVSDEPITISLLSAVCVVEWIDLFYAIHPAVADVSCQSIFSLLNLFVQWIPIPGWSWQSVEQRTFSATTDTLQKHVLLLARSVRGKFDIDLSNKVVQLWLVF